MTQITSADIALLNVAIDIFIRTGNPALQNEAQRSSNERLALSCINKLAKEELGFTKNECDVIFMAVSFMLENLARVSSTKAYLYGARLKELKKVFDVR